MAKTATAPYYTRWLPSLLAPSIPQVNLRPPTFLQKSKIENAMPPVNDNDNSDSSSAVQVAVRVRPMLALEHGNSRVSSGALKLKPNPDWQKIFYI